MTDALDGGLVINRGRLTHGDTKRLTRLLMCISRGADDLEEYDRQVAEYEGLLARTVEVLPEDWLPPGVSLATEGWINHISQPRYEQIAQAVIMQPTPGKKTD
ncbi:MAG: hypothetical protein L6Q98_08450 [Anaerolineae bacterium]|nr:hypothetical protein [Anaerolineae bacterium]NUQ02619.1 hypothetical protein [Anaerolineae bacterium]